MRNLKKFLALVLAMMMTLSLMVTVNAATTKNQGFENEDVTEAFKEDITVLAGMGVVQGHADSNTFQPKDKVTRAQMATIIYRMVTGDVSNNREPYGAGYGNFKDIKGDEWFAGAVGYCANAGLIVGYPDGNYHPFKQVTGYEALVMILRAMGYNQPGQNFVGSDWAVRALSTATERGMMANIVKTVYNNTYSLAAPRELVAEMAFQGMTKPMVRWTGSTYERYGMEGGILSSILNPTLGETYFGLTNHKGIVVGNAYTGEGEHNTKIGFSMDVSIDKGLNVGDKDTGTADWVVRGDLASATINDDVSKAAYYYLSGLPYDTGDYGVTLNFKWDSDLSLFNHAVDVWYDCRGASNETVTLSSTANPTYVSGSVTYKTDLPTYAVFDRVVKTQVVTAPDAALNGTVDATPNENLAEVVLGAGFTRRTGTDANKAFFNYAFARNAAANWDTDTAAGDSFSGPSPIIANNGEGSYADTQTPTQSATNTHPLYLVISNTPGNVVDVVVTLDLTLSEVVQNNDTQAPASTGILTENDSVGNTTTYRYFDTWDQIDPTIGDDYSNIADKNRVDDYDARLGDYVAAIAITGTNEQPAPGYKTGVTAGVATATDGNAVAAGNNPTGTSTAAMNSTFWYQMKKLERTVTGTMVKFDQNTDTIHLLVNGETKVYPRSIFALATDGSFQPGEHVWAPRASGEYTFYLDANDNWLFWEQKAPTSTFVYGTYIDWQTQVASSTFRYPLVYTNAAGEEKLTNDITSIGGVDMSVTAYANIMLPKRDQVTGSNSGFVPGQYIGYEMSESKLTPVTTTPGASGFKQAGTGSGDFGEGTETTTITAQSVAIGAHPVTDKTAAGGARLFLTNRTKFIVVNGAGTDNQEVKVYEGLAEFLGTHKSVTIDATTEPIPSSRLGKYLSDDVNPANSTDYAGKTDPYQMVYYNTEEDPYSQNYDQMDKHIDTVFIPVQLITSEDDVTGNLFFVGDKTHGLIDATNEATQYTFYQNDVKSTLWIDGLYDGDDDSDADTVTALGNNVFYQLRDSGEKAVDGGAIYKLVPFESLDAADATIIGQYYGYDDTVANGRGTCSTTAAAQTSVDGTTTGKGYLATTRYSQVAYIGGRAAGDLFNIQSANVLNLDESLTINSIGDLNDQSSLTSNQGVDVSCVLGDSAKLISFIYVNCQ